MSASKKQTNNRVQVPWPRGWQQGELNPPTLSPWPQAPPHAHSPSQSPPASQLQKGRAVPDPTAGPQLRPSAPSPASPHPPARQRSHTHVDAREGTPVPTAPNCCVFLLPQADRTSKGPRRRPERGGAGRKDRKPFLSPEAGGHSSAPCPHGPPRTPTVHTPHGCGQPWAPGLGEGHVPAPPASKLPHVPQRPPPGTRDCSQSSPHGQGQLETPPSCPPSTEPNLEA